MRIIKSSILEATFKGQNHINKHYDDHVLKPDEEFNPSNPKFPYMEKEEYLKQAEELSLEKPDNSNIIEYKVDKSKYGEVFRNPRINKIRIKSKFKDGFADFVSYVDDDKAGNQIFTFYLLRPDKLNSILKSLKGEEK